MCFRVGGRRGGLVVATSVVDVGGGVVKGVYDFNS